MKSYKAGQLFNHNGRFYRFAKATSLCEGCALDDIQLCPNIVDRRGRKFDLLPCVEKGLILKKV